MGETGHVYRTAYPSCEVQILTRNVLIMGRRLLSGDVIAHTKETNAPLSDYKQYFMEVCYLSFKNLMKLINTDTVYIAFCDTYGEYVQVDRWGRFDGLNLLKAITKWGGYIVKSATPLDHSLEVVLYA